MNHAVGHAHSPDNSPDGSPGGLHGGSPGVGHAVGHANSPGAGHAVSHAASPGASPTASPGNSPSGSPAASHAASHVDAPWRIGDSIIHPEIDGEPEPPAEAYARAFIGFLQKHPALQELLGGWISSRALWHKYYPAFLATIANAA
jgi:hypothetical protein